jgi:hypothetical protein
METNIPQSSIIGVCASLRFITIDRSEIGPIIYSPTKKSNISVFLIAASISSFCRVCLLDFSAAPHALKVISNIKISHALAKSTGAEIIFIG